VIAANTWAEAVVAIVEVDFRSKFARLSAIIKRAVPSGSASGKGHPCEVFF
jgi:hypothetical protein